MKRKHLPRLWCAVQGLLPLEACLAVQRGELAWPPEPETPVKAPPSPISASAVSPPVKRGSLSREAEVHP